MSYAQNIDVQNTEYGEAVVLPGPALNTITNNSEITGLPFIKAQQTSNSTIGFEYIIFAEGVLGATNQLRIVSGVTAGGTPVIDTNSTHKKTVTHNDAAGADTGHTGIIVDEIESFVDSSGNVRLLVLGKDATDIWLQYAGISASGNRIGTLFQVTTPTSRLTHEHKLLYSSYANKIYISRGAVSGIIASVATDLSTVTATAFSLPRGYQVTGLIDFDRFLAISYCLNDPGDFSQRKAAGRSGIILWNQIVTNSTQPDNDIACPSSYISAMVKAPTGNTYVFGGLDQGKTTIYEFTGYSFNPLYTYVGDMPRNRHSVTFDAQGRLMWNTVDGQLLRLNPFTRQFDHLGSVTTTTGYGGLLCKLLGGTGNDFLVGNGVDATPDTFTLKKVVFGSYLGDGDSTDGVTTPLAIAGQVALKPKSVVMGVEVKTQKALASGDKLEARLYANGSSSSTTLGTFSFSNDGAVASKNIRSTQYNVDNANIGFAWKMTDNSTTAPGIIEANLLVNEIPTL